MGPIVVDHLGHALPMVGGPSAAVSICRHTPLNDRAFTRALKNLSVEEKRPERTFVPGLPRCSRAGTHRFNDCSPGKGRIAMPSENGEETSKTEKFRPQKTVSSHLPALTLEQQRVVNTYCCGQMEEPLFQQHLASDPVLARYVRLKCRPSREGWLPPTSGMPSKGNGH